MGTRHLICVVKDNEYKVAQYGQWDGYPEGQGIDILNFLKEDMNRDLFLNKLNNVSYISDEEWTKRWIAFGVDLDDSGGWVTNDISDKFYKKYPEFSRDTGSDILSIIQNSNRDLKLRNSIDFAGDSLFCEWSYVIDFDKNIFEVYKGFNKNLLTENERFFGFKQSKEEYYPVKLMVSFDINKLPTNKDFLDAFKYDEDDE